MERTFVIIKPDGVQRKLIGEIIKRIENTDLVITNIKTSRLREDQVLKIYSDSLRKFPKIFTPILKYMTEGNSILLIIEGKDAIKKVREIRGHSDPSTSPLGSVRRDFAGDQLMSELTSQGKVTKNIMHASGSPSEVEFEINLFFPENEL